MSVSLKDLNSLNLLNELPEKRKEEVSAQLHVKTFRRNEVVVHKGQPSAELYFLLKGRLKVVDYSPSGREIGFIIIEAGAHFGEMALIDGEPRSASIIATEISNVAILHKQNARQLMYSEASVSEKLLKKLSAIIRQNNEHMVMLGSNSAASRINTLLLKYAKRTGEHLVIEKLPTQTELATMTNTTRETVSRTISHLLEEGLVEKNGKQLIILDPDELEEMAQE